MARNEAFQPQLHVNICSSCRRNRSSTWQFTIPPCHCGENKRPSYAVMIVGREPGDLPLTHCLSLSGRIIERSGHCETFPAAAPVPVPVPGLERLTYSASLHHLRLWRQRSSICVPKAMNLLVQGKKRRNVPFRGPAGKALQGHQYLHPPIRIAYNSCCSTNIASISGGYLVENPWPARNT
jgi:hypothetical protein